MQIIHEYLKYFFVKFFSYICSSPYSYIFFHFKNLPGKQSHIEIYAYSLYIFNIWIRYSWILWQIFMNRNNICQIIIFANRNNIYLMKLWRIEIWIYLASKYQRIDLWQIYLQTIHELFANIELFAKHWCSQGSSTNCFVSERTNKSSSSSKSFETRRGRPCW